jgi:hypothetical protein
VRVKNGDFVSGQRGQKKNFGVDSFVLSLVVELVSITDDARLVSRLSTRLPKSIWLLLGVKITPSSLSVLGVVTPEQVTDSSSFSRLAQPEYSKMPLELVMR